MFTCAKLSGNRSLLVRYIFVAYVCMYVYTCDYANNSCAVSNFITSQPRGQVQFQGRNIVIPSPGRPSNILWYYQPLLVFRRMVEMVDENAASSCISSSIHNLQANACRPSCSYYETVNLLHEFWIYWPVDNS